jgi:hypothetical protein
MGSAVDADADAESEVAVEANANVNAKKTMPSIPQMEQKSPMLSNKSSCSQ